MSETKPAQTNWEAEIRKLSPSRGGEHVDALITNNGAPAAAIYRRPEMTEAVLLELVDLVLANPSIIGQNPDVIDLSVPENAKKYLVRVQLYDLPVSGKLTGISKVFGIRAAEEISNAQA